MSRPFTLPVVIACSAHALLMFGFSKPPANPTPKPPVEKTKIFEYPVVPPDEMEKPELIESLDKPEGGKLAEPAPMSMDRPATDISPFDIIMEMTKSELVDVKVTTKVIPVGPGSPNGDPNAKEFGPGVPDGKPVFPSTALDNTPRTRVQTPPSYPFNLKASGISGEVVVEFTVDERGRVMNPRVLHSTHSDFEAPTLSAVAKWRFEPGTRNMAPVRFKMVVPVKFNLNE